MTTGSMCLDTKEMQEIHSGRIQKIVKTIFFTVKILELTTEWAFLQRTWIKIAGQAAAQKLEGMADGGSMVVAQQTLME